MKTARGIYLNLEESDYIYELNDLIFYFSSKLYLEKYKSNVEEFITIETNKLAVRYKVKADLSKYFSLVYYKMVERRGFRVYDKDKQDYVINGGKNEMKIGV